MNLKQAYKFLEIPETSSLSEIKQAYRDLVQIWHPDRYAHNERLQRKAQEKMKHLNAAYEELCSYIASRENGYTENKQEERPAYENIVCSECGTKNRVNFSGDHASAKCGKCGSYLYEEKQAQNDDDAWGDEERILCGDGACIGIIDSSGRCGICHKTFKEGVEAEKQAQNDDDAWGDEERILCGDGACIGIIDSSGRCGICHKTFKEGVEAEKQRT